MRIKSNYHMREIVGEYVIVPLGEEALRINAVLRVNEQGAFIIEQLREERTHSEVLDAVLREFEGDRDFIEQNVAHFIEELRRIGMIEE